ncbi:MAG: M23 family metallopeptidase [Cyanobacteria bacterium REEB67]|nr:M23 family metallopeptidase [Cyanobacteria bacterium REEB67]
MPKTFRLLPLACTLLLFGAAAWQAATEAQSQGRRYAMALHETLAKNPPAQPLQTGTNPGLTIVTPLHPLTPLNSPKPAYNTTNYSTTPTPTPAKYSAAPAPLYNTSAAPAYGNRGAADQPFTCQLLNEQGQSVLPSAFVRGNGRVFLLAPDCLYMANQPLPSPESGGTLNLITFNKPGFSQVAGTPGTLPIPVHEFVNLVYNPFRQTVFVLDKSGDIFEFDPQKQSWGVLRANLPSGGSPDPEYIDLCLSPAAYPASSAHAATNAGAPSPPVLNRLNLLDPERNQIWKLALTKSGPVPPQMKKSFPEIMPWRVGPGNPSVAESIALSFDTIYYVLRNFSQSGQIGLIRPISESAVQQSRLPIRGMKRIRPTRMVSQPGLPLYIVERENNRVLAVDKHTGATRPFLFNGQSDLRGVCPDACGFWVIDGNKLTYRQLSKPDSLAVANHPPVRTIDDRLKKLHLPIVGINLPRHAGVYPGARRLYRYGVHEGMDFFYGGGTAKIYMGSPVVAAADGKIIRADANFHDMNLATLNRVMADCVREHRTSDKNEDLFRGCQVWIDHGNNMITRYAHLDKINSNIKVGQTVRHGDLIGFVGVSGTGQNLPGRTKYPHLHFEIWLDGKYLGYGLTPAETVGIFENIFGTI